MTVQQAVKQGPQSPAQCKRPPEPTKVLLTKCTPGGGNKVKRFNHYVIVCTYYRSLFARKLRVVPHTVHKYDNITLHIMLYRSHVENHHYGLSNRRGYIRKRIGLFVPDYPTPTKSYQGTPHPPYTKGQGTIHCPQDLSKEIFFQKTPTDSKGQGGQIEGSTPRGNPPLPSRKGVIQELKPHLLDK